ncbi:MAG: sugar ABC transporter substrate-binding protein, partial [Verrucomicrobiota bacterium]
MKTKLIAFTLACLAPLAGCKKSGTPERASQDDKLTIGVAFETLQTEFWVAGFEAIRADLQKRGHVMLEAVADNDANRQLEQVKNFITRKVDGIILVPKDAKTCLPMIKAANAANIPIVLFNRPADKSDARSVAVVADNAALTRQTVDYLVAEARKGGKKLKAAVLLGDLGDINAIGRRDGFEAAVKGQEDILEVVARIPTEWNQEKAQSGVVNALQAHPDIGLIFTSSDFLFPSIVSALKSVGK